MFRLSASALAILLLSPTPDFCAAAELVSPASGQRVALADAIRNSFGPIANPGMNVLVDADGVQAPGYRFENRCVKPAEWQASWIWAEDDTNDHGYFRKEIVHDANPRKVSAWVSADRKYRLWINGRLVSRGPADIGCDYSDMMQGTCGQSTGRWFHDFRDLTPFFHEGTNLVSPSFRGK